MSPADAPQDMKDVLEIKTLSARTCKEERRSNFGQKKDAELGMGRKSGGETDGCSAGRRRRRRRCRGLMGPDNFPREEEQASEDPSLFIRCEFPSKGQKMRPSGKINFVQVTQQVWSETSWQTRGIIKGRVNFTYRRTAMK